MTTEPAPRAHPDASSRTGTSGERPWYASLRSTPAILALSGCIQLGLLGYAAYVDSHPERFGGVKYTDVDWRVVYDGVRHAAHPRPGEEAEGWLVRALGLPLGSPYHRATFRYTPLLVVVLAPALLAQVAGRLVLVALTLALPLVLLGGPEPADFWKTHLLWTLNPMVWGITTRGSPEALPCLLTALLVVACRRAGLGTSLRRKAATLAPAAPASPTTTTSDITQRPSWKRDVAAAALLAIATSYKIYPAIYVPSIWTALARNGGWLGPRVWRFAAVGAGTAIVLNGVLWSFWGQPFLEHTFLYHLSRLDHRHNFSPYFLSYYYQLASPPEALSPLMAFLRHPLTSFLPQVTVVLCAGLGLTRILGLEAAMFFQTCLFVAFNKVSTSQYFLWPLPLVPLLAFPRLSWAKLAALLGAWAAAQGAWLATAYQLEFEGRPVYVPLFAASCALLAVSAWAVGELMVAAVPEAGAGESEGK